MKYLRLRFENAMIKAEEHKRSIAPSGCSSLDQANFNNADWNNPIGVDQVSNMLHVMFGLPPKPSKRPSVYERNEHIYKIAHKSFIKYDDYKAEDVKHRKEVMLTAKAKFNCNQALKSVIDGVTYNSVMTWDYFQRRFGKNEQHLLKEILSFFNETLNVDDVRKHYYFGEFMEEFHKHLNDEKVKKFINQRLCKGGDFYGTGKPLNITFFNLITGSKIGGNSCSYSDRTPLLLTKGLGQKISLSGELIIPLEDEDCEYIQKNGILPTILDGGMITVVSFTKNVDEIELQMEFMPLSELKTSV